MIARTSLIAAAMALVMLPLAASQALGAGAASGKKSKASHTDEPAQNVTAPLLRESISIEGKVIYLGDLFLNVGDLAHRAVAYSPPPGERAVFDARWLYRVARAYRLQWRPLSMRQQVVVERVSQVIERAEIEDAILAALYEKGADPDSELELSVQLSRIHVPIGLNATVGIDDITYEPRARRFAAIVSAPANDPAGKKLRLTGKLHNVIKVPVPARALARGDTVTKRDIKWVRVRADRVMPDTITKAEDLIDMAAKRGLRADLLIRQSDVERPVLIPRGSMVTVTLNHGPLALSAQGKSLESGAMGDTIRIINGRSKSVFEGLVIGPGRARVDLTSAHELAEIR